MTPASQRQCAGKLLAERCEPAEASYTTSPCHACGLLMPTKIPDVARECCLGCVIRQHLVDEFPRLCLACCISTGRTRKTVLYRGAPSLIVEANQRLRFILPAHYSWWNGFWIPKTKERARFNFERQDIRRRGRSIHGKPPMWRGESRPAGAQEVLFECTVENCALLWSAKRWLFRGSFPKSAMPGWRYKRPSRAKHKEQCALCGKAFLTNQTIQLYCSESCTDKARLPSHGWKAQQVVDAIRKHDWSDPVPYAVYEAVYEEQRVSIVAAKRNISRKTLSQCAWIVRKDLPPAASPE